MAVIMGPDRRLSEHLQLWRQHSAVRSPARIAYAGMSACGSGLLIRTCPLLGKFAIMRHYTGPAATAPTNATGFARVVSSSRSMSDSEFSKLSSPLSWTRVGRGPMKSRLHCEVIQLHAITTGISWLSFQFIISSVCDLDSSRDRCRVR